jgi:hypothetical protein
MIIGRISKHSKLGPRPFMPPTNLQGELLILSRIGGGAILSVFFNFHERLHGREGVECMSVVKLYCTGYPALVLASAQLAPMQRAGKCFVVVIFSKTLQSIP